jgi:hypothetical protein
LLGNSNYLVNLNLNLISHNHINLIYTPHVPTPFCTRAGGAPLQAHPLGRVRLSSSGQLSPLDVGPGTCTALTQYGSQSIYTGGGSSMQGDTDKDLEIQVGPRARMCIPRVLDPARVLHPARLTIARGSCMRTRLVHACVLGVCGWDAGRWEAHKDLEIQVGLGERAACHACVLWMRRPTTNQRPRRPPASCLPTHSCW